MSPERRWILVGAAGIILLLAILLIRPNREEFGRLWKRSLTAIEYDGPTGVVRFEKESGWFADRFYVVLRGQDQTVQHDGVRFPATPAVKGIFAEFEAPIVKGEYVLTADEANRRFAIPRCARLFDGGSPVQLCAGIPQNGLISVRLPEDPLRIFLLPDHIFARLQMDATIYMERRLLVLPAGTVPDRLRIGEPGKIIDLFRTTESVVSPDGGKGELSRWFIGEKEVPVNLVNALLSTLYEFQRDQLAIPEPDDASPLYSIVLDVKVEGPSTGGPLNRLLGRQTLEVHIFSPAVESDFYGAVVGDEALHSGIQAGRIEKMKQAIQAVEASYAQKR